MATSPLEHAADTRMALREIVSEHGVAALSNPSIMSNLLRDLLPDAPQVTRLLVAAAEDRIAEVLAQHVAQGLDAAMAQRLAASSFANTTLFTPEICEWVVGEIAVAAGLAAGAGLNLGGQAETLVATTPSTSNPPPSNPPPGDPLRGNPVPGGQQETIQQADRPLAGTDQTIGAQTLGISAPGIDIAGPVPLPVKPRPRWLIPGAAGAAVVVLLAVILVWAPWSTTSVLQPTGLAQQSAGLSTITFRWLGPATGPVPTKYEILIGGHVAGSVPGTTTSTKVSDLQPDTTYRFQVVAVRGSQRSAKSAVLVLTTSPDPSLSEAVLEGRWTMNPGHATWYGYSKSPLPLDDETWTFVPSCSSGPCSVSLSGEFQGVNFSTTLARSGGTYSGTATYTYSNPAGSSCGPSTTGDLTIKINVQGAAVVDNAWEASSWTGSLVSRIPAGKCTAAGIAAAISSSR